MAETDTENNIVIDGFDSGLIVSGGLGDDQPQPAPSDPITNHLERAKSLFATQFRQVREL